MGSVFVIIAFSVLFFAVPVKIGYEALVNLAKINLAWFGFGVVIVVYLAREYSSWLAKIVKTF